MASSEARISPESAPSLRRGLLLGRRGLGPGRRDPVHPRIRDRLAEVLVGVVEKLEKYPALGHRMSEEVDLLFEVGVGEAFDGLAGVVEGRLQAGDDRRLVPDLLFHLGAGV